MIVIGEPEAAAFELVGEADFLRKPADDHEQTVCNPASRGRTDRFVRNFR